MMGPGRFALDKVLLQGIESVYALLIISLCILIYIKAKEMYDLTGHKGLKYFKNTFLLFAMLYLLRLVGGVFSIFSHSRFSHTPLVIIFVMLYTSISSLAILSLALSTVWKWFAKNSLIKEAFVYGLVIISVIISLVSRSPEIVFLTQFLLFIFSAVMALLNHIKAKKKSKTSKLYIVYILLFFFWILHMGISVPRWAYFEVSILVYLFSFGLFSFIAYRVFKVMK